MQRNYCDKCLEEVEGKLFYVLFSEFYLGTRDKRNELCERCSQEIAELINGEKPRS